MGAFDSYLNGLVNINRENFREFPDIKWLNPYQAGEFQEKRDNLLENFKDSLLFKDTKPFYHQISGGCQRCGQGTWSCLFITNKCNGSCFYCPVPQQADEPPSSQGLTFETPEAYAEYINFFRFDGVSFSGGEPLLFFDRTLRYLEEVRKSCDPGIYIWMYTNGLLADETKFRKLADAGLNEVRFDIGATGFKLDRIKPAKNIIPNITIEIPAVPEEKENLIKLLPEMAEAGVTNLNLHQLRLTKHNAPKLVKRSYTFIQAEQPVALESELAALEIMEAAKKQNPGIGINYCSFFFKNRFQKAGFRRQVANVLADPDEVLTEKGFIRDFNRGSVGYKTFKISDYGNTSTPGEVIELKYKSYHVSKGYALKEINLDNHQAKEAQSLFETEPEQIPFDHPLFDIWQFEYIEKGLREY
jgi:pyruvate formate-lyase activating enzyme-like uncharacterized protein